MKKRLVLMISALSRHDGMGNDVLQIFDVAREMGLDALMVSDHNHTENTQVISLKQYARNIHAGDILVYCHGMHWLEGCRFFRTFEGKKVLRYQNVTPPELFRHYNGLVADACSRGREETEELLMAMPDAIWPPSGYSANELESMGAPKEKISIVPVFHCIEEIQQVEADEAMKKKFRDGFVNFISLGRMVPNKGYHHLIEAMGVLCASGYRKARLLLVGKTDDSFSSYVTALENRIDQLKIRKHVEFIKNVNLRQVRSLYEVSRAFMLCSQHEGFCVPVVEAMSFGLPVVALATTALPYTVGGAGLLWPSKDPRIWAATMHQLAVDDKLVASMSACGRARYEKTFTSQAIAEDFKKAWKKLLD